MRSALIALALAALLGAAHGYRTATQDRCANTPDPWMCEAQAQ